MVRSNAVRLCLGVAVAAAALTASTFTQVSTALAWEPTEKVTLVTHSRQGTGNDLILREYVRIWEKHNMLPVGAEVKNVRGGGGAKARVYVAKQHKDDAHLLWSYTPTQLIRPLIRKDDINHTIFSYIAMTAIDPMILAVSNESKYKTLKDLVEDAKANPGKVVQGGGPFGNSSSVQGEVFKGGYNLDMPYTPFDSGSSAVLQLLGGHIDFIIENPAEVKEHVDAGKIRILATSDKLDIFPDVPTFDDAGYPMTVMSSFRAVLAPPNMPSEAQAYYIDLLKKTVATDEWADYLKKNAIARKWMAGDDFKAYIAKEAEWRSEVLKKLGLFKE